MTTMQNFEVNIEDANEKLIKTNMFQLLQWKHALALEMKGLTNSRGSVYAHLCKKLSAPNFGLENMHNYICTCIENINEQIGV